MKNHEIKNIIDMFGLYYAISRGVDPNNIEDQRLKELFEIAKYACEDIDAYLSRDYQSRSYSFDL